MPAPCHPARAPVCPATPDCFPHHCTGMQTLSSHSLLQDRKWMSRGQTSERRDLPVHLRGHFLHSEECEELFSSSLHYCHADPRAAPNPFGILEASLTPEHPWFRRSPTVHASRATVTEKLNISQLEGKKGKPNRSTIYTSCERNWDHRTDHKGTLGKPCCIKSLVDMLLKIHTADFWAQSPPCK